MSVALISPEELGQFVADAVRSKIVPSSPVELNSIYRILELVSLGNIMAYRETYNETPEFEHASAEEIERAALDILAGRYSVGHWGPIAYNCIANCGKAFVGGNSVPQDCEILTALANIENKVRSWKESQQREELRKTEDAA